MLNTRVRGFEVAKGFEDADINLPRRSTAMAAGYDFEAAEDTVIPSIWKVIARSSLFRPGDKLDNANIKPTLVSTGVKSYMPDNEYLKLVNRSSGPLKQFLLLSNGVGVVDSDYYGNEDNDGHIMFQFINFGFTDKVIKKGERIGQGIFQPFRRVDNDSADAERKGGHGHTGK